MCPASIWAHFPKKLAAYHSKWPYLYNINLKMQLRNRIVADAGAWNIKVALYFLIALKFLAVIVPTKEQSMHIALSRTLRTSDKWTKSLAPFKKIPTFMAVIGLILHPVAAQENNIIPKLPNAEQPASNLKTDDGLTNRVIASEMGYEIHEAGASFQPDESGVACFTKTGQYRTDDHGIRLTYVRRNPDLFIDSNFDKIDNKYNIVFGNNYCRYTVTIQREIKVNGRWRPSTMLK